MRVKFGRIIPLVDKCKRSENRLSQFAERHDDAEDREGRLTEVAAALSSAWLSSAQLIVVLSPIGSEGCFNARPGCSLRAPLISAHCLSARLQHCSHHAFRLSAANRLERSVITSVTAIDSN